MANHDSAKPSLVASKKKQRRQPSDKQRKAIAIAAQNGGNISRAMVEAGYSPNTAKTPQKLTESEYVQELMHEVGLTDLYGFKLLKEGMESTKTIVMGKESSESFVDIQPDYQTRHKYLETFLRVRGLGKSLEGTTNYNFTNITTTDKDAFNL